MLGITSQLNKCLAYSRDEPEARVLPGCDAGKHDYETGKV